MSMNELSSLPPFLPTPSARRATAHGGAVVALSMISTHALREEGDVFMLCSFHLQKCISTHALREEGDKPVCHSHHLSKQFLPTPSARRATWYGHCPEKYD